MRRNARFAVRCLVATLLLAGWAEAQTLGRLVGVVRDPSGAGIPGATVTVKNEATGIEVTAVTTNDGRFLLPQMAVGSYTVTVSITGFKTATYSAVKIEPGQEYSLPVSLAVGDISESVLVEAGADLIHTTTPSITATVTQEQMLSLPLNGRNPIELIRLQAGVVGIPTKASTAVNGGRPTWTEITQDGINIQDNFIRTNSLDFVPNRPTPDNVAEFTIVTNTQGVDAIGGASQVQLVTPSGGNAFHGSVYEFNRHSRFGANTWFNNRDGIERAYLNRHQFGGRLSGPVIKDRLFFFGYYEGFREKQERTQNMTIPRNDDFLSGIFRYSGGRTVNLLELSGLRPDAEVRNRVVSRVPSASNVNNSDVGDGINTGGYRFLVDDLNSRDHFGGRLDFHLNEKHHFEAVFHYMKQKDDRTDIDAVNKDPLVFVDSSTRLFSGAWRWQPRSNVQNELRVGANLAPVDFVTEIDYGNAIVPSGLLTNPIPSFQPQGRNTRFYQLSDTGTWVTGQHSVQFGGAARSIRVNPYTNFGRTPILTFGFSPAAPASVQLTAAQFPGGISPADLTRANSHLAFLSGTISQISRTFQVQDKTTGFIPGIANDRDYTLSNYALFVQDSWSALPNLTVRAGLKWEYYTPLKEDNGLGLAPVTNGRPMRDVILDPVGVLDFAPGPFYGKDAMNLVPSVGVAWDPFKDGRTSVRAGYTLAHINEETIAAARNAVNGNPGLDTNVTLVNQYTTLSAGVPEVPIPAFKVPRTYADQAALSSTSVVFAIDPDLKQPSVHQISFSVEREITRKTALEVRYIANLGRNLFTGIDLNQIQLSDQYLNDFKRARKNGFLAQERGGTFNPAYDPSIPGSEPLTVITQFGGGLLTNSTVRSRIQAGEPGSLIDFYVTQRVPGAREAFLPNPGVYAADLMINGSGTDYHGLQIELRRRLSEGFLGQINYTFGKSLSDTSGTAQARFEPLLDNARPKLHRGRSPFDVTHILNGNFVYDLPFGKGKRFLDREGALDRLVGGWKLSSIVHWQSGSPLTFLSARGTFNRGGRSGLNTADSTLSRDQLKGRLGIRKTPDGKVYFVDPALLDTTGRGVGPDNLNNTASFPGQVFFNPAAGEVGEMGINTYDGPTQWSWDLSLAKHTRINDKFDTELRIDVFNVPNHPHFFVDDMNVNSTTFGVVSSLNQDPRIVQIAFKVNF